MIPVFTAADMRAVDARAIADLGIPGPRLMENAGAGATHLIAREFRPIRGRRVVVLCGKGNNGGDGFVVARRLKSQGAAVQLFLVGRRQDVAGDAAIARDRWSGRIAELVADSDLGPLARELGRTELIVDALLGTGLTGPARGLTARVIDMVNEAGHPVVSLDVPSGLPSDDGTVLGPTVRASFTPTFVGYKRSLVLQPGAAYAGRVRVVDIGIPRDEGDRGIATFLLEEPDIRRHFPARAVDAHKGSFGHVLVIAGSLGKTGAAALAGRSALRSGAGLCTIATPASQQPVVASLGMEYMTEPLAETAGQALSLGARSRVLELASRVDAVALGPGISMDPETQELVRALVVEVARPMVIDADALNALAGHLEILERVAAPRVLTPHPGEMARLLGASIAEVQADRLETVRRFCTHSRAALALKGAGTVIGGPDGRVFINPTGNPGMASGGSGDVLTGMSGAFLARGLDAVTALQAACFIHGLAGDFACAEHGEEGLIAGDIVNAIGRAMKPSSPVRVP
ncbi:MAG: bifunctional ADP-dependent NAD(P)H-hydrate dehydratase/NAD(P)H-hydrate epimerase [Candidatus Rokuibacteriota bacterium]|nr:MAG: bifunctional ADP-dependent NAD(P)H-hydrate dehydratase/NAD(P)H-hydrate epimerase [Candidatus Rokubacteria bacterium]